MAFAGARAQPRRLIDLPFDPNLHVGAFSFAWHSIFALVGMMLGSVASFAAARYLVRDDRIYPFTIAVVVGGIIGARAAHVIDNWSVYAARPQDIVAFWNGGIGTMGAPIGSTIAGVVAARWLRLPLGFMFDIAVIGISLGEAVGRIGDVINGEHHAIACEVLPWCVRYTNPATLGQHEYVHPIAVYDGLIMLAIFVALRLYWLHVRGHPPEGRVYWAYLLLFGGARFLTSFLRLDPAFLGGLQEAQVLGLVYAAAGAIMLPLLTARARLDPRASSATTMPT